MSEGSIPTLPLEWHDAMRRAVAEFGGPIFGLAGPLATEGVLNGHGGRPCNEVVLRYRPGASRIEVRTACHPLGGTNRMMDAVLQASAWGAALPFTVTVTERLAMIPVSGGRAQFRVIEASTGHWEAAGGVGKSHLLIGGSPGVTIEELALTPVALDFNG